MALFDTDLMPDLCLYDYQNVQQALSEWMLTNESLSVFVVEIMCARIRTVTYMRVYVAIDDLAYESPLNPTYNFFRATIDKVDDYSRMVTTALLRVKAYEFDRGVPLSIASDRSWSTSGSHEGSYVSRLNSDIISGMLVESVTLLPARNYDARGVITTMPGISPFVGGLRSRLSELQRWDNPNFTTRYTADKVLSSRVVTDVANGVRVQDETNSVNASVNTGVHTRSTQATQSVFERNSHESREVADFVCPGCCTINTVLRRRTLLRVVNEISELNSDGNPVSDDEVLDVHWHMDDTLTKWKGKVWVFSIGQGQIHFEGFESVRIMRQRCLLILTKATSVIVLMASEVYAPWFWRYTCEPIIELFAHKAGPSNFNDECEDVLATMQQLELSGDCESGLTHDQLNTIRQLREEDAHEQCHSSLDAMEFHPHTVPPNMCFVSQAGQQVYHEAHYEFQDGYGYTVSNGCTPRHMVSPVPCRTPTDV